MAIDPAVTRSGSSKLIIEESRRLIDMERAELYELYRRLNSRRNLPLLYHQNYWDRSSILLTKEIQNIQVQRCRRCRILPMFSQQWRNIALDTPGLWDTPTFDCATWGRAMLERSKMADLVVHSNTSRIHNPDLLKEIFDKHAARIREINLCGLEPSFLSSILENVRPSSLRLRSLHLSRSIYSVSPSDDEPGLPFFPAQLLVQQDNLKHLTTRACAFDVYAQPHPLLTHLTVERPLDRPLLSEFVAALSGMPALETLEMDDSLPLATKAINLGLKVELPKLSFLQLSSSNFFEILNVLDSLVIPWKTRIKIYCTEPILRPKDSVIQLADIPPLDVFFSSMRGTAEGRSYNQLALRDELGSCQSLAAWRSEQLDEEEDLLLELDLPDIESGHIFPEIFPCIPLSDLRTLIIIGHYDARQDTFFRYFGQSTTIQTVQLRSLVVSKLLLTLTCKPESFEHLENAHYSVSFPALQSLEFYHTAFKDVKDFVDCLRVRCERGAKLQKLAIGKCRNIYDQDVRLLREIVSVVEWDRVVQEYEDSSYSTD